MIAHYETHLTVELKDKTLEDFKDACEAIKAKAIIINLKDVDQVMTSKRTVSPSCSTVFEEAMQDTTILTEHGFEVIRAKIETNQIEDGSKYSYVEIHVPCHSRKLVEYPHLIDQLILTDSEGNEVKGHISRNEFKPNVTFITWRSKLIEDFEHFPSLYNTLIELEILSDPTKDPKLEIIVEDTNEGLDNTWIHGEIV